MLSQYGMIHNNYTLSSKNPNQVARVWLMASYLYYCRYDVESFLTDAEFDALTKILLENYEPLTIPVTFPNGDSNPPLSDLITMENLTAGSAYNLREHDYPSITRDAAVFMARDKFWSLKQTFIFNFPLCPRLGERYELDEDKVWEGHTRDDAIAKIIALEPALQDPERYYGGDPSDEDYDREREYRGALLKDREAEEFYDTMLYLIDKELKPGNVLGSISYVEGVGWKASVYDPTRTIIIETD